jgi:hypothetical protein
MKHHGWSTNGQTLDPSATMVVMQATARPEGHWPRVEAMQRRRRRERGLWNAVLGAAVMLATWAAWALVAALLTGCSATWTRLPDPKPGVSAYKVEVRWGLEVP